MRKNIKAFTLAEVLITLGIIGIVAAITIPNLVQKYRKYLVETRMKQFYVTINEAIKLSENENDEATAWEFPTGYYSGRLARDFLNKYMLPYLSGNVRIIDALAGVFITLPSGVDTYWEIGPNGAQIIMRPLDYKHEAPTAGVGGVNYFYFNLTKGNRVITPYRYWGRGYCTNGGDCCYAGIEGSHAQCAREIWANNWKVPKDYPFKF